MRKLLLIGMLFLFIPLVSAREVLNASDCEVQANQVIEGVLLVFCENLRISGEVNGDVVGAALRTQIDGRVNGDLYLISGQLDVTGHIGGDLHFAGPVLRLNPPPGDESLVTNSQQIDGGLKAVTLSSTLFKGARVADGIMYFGYQLVIYGDVDSELNFWGSLLDIEGEVAGDVYASVGDPNSESSQLETLLLPLNFDFSLRNPGLILAESGRINGDLHYSGPQPGLIEGQIAGMTEHTEPPPVVPTLDEPGTISLYFESFGREFTTLLVIGILALMSMNRFLHAPLRTMRVRPFASVAVGMLAFLLSFPIVLIVLLLSLLILGFFQLIGLSGVVLALGLVLGLVDLGGVSIFYFVAIFLTRTLVGLALGRFLLGMRFQRRDIDEHPMRYLALVIGVLVLTLIVSLPVIGILFNALALFWGLGAMLHEVIIEFNRVREPAQTTLARLPASAPRPSLPHETETIITPPPVADEPLSDVAGTKNLPEGFDWSFFEE